MDSINYESAGVNIGEADELKRQIRGSVSAGGVAHCVPLNSVGAFASLVEIGLSAYKNPVFVLKSEEPGSKQLLSIDNGRIEWIAHDLINHLVNDVIVMGALPCAVLDTVICGKMERDVVYRLITAMSEACAENGCVLVGGETSEQPGVLPPGRYILQASMLGVVDRDRIIDGAKIKEGDALLALPSNGLHTNGYSLVRKLMEEKPSILDEKAGGAGFLDCILAPHTSYAAAVRNAIDNFYGGIHGMAHITGGGMRDNLVRILKSDKLRAAIDLSAVRAHEIFGIIKKYANAEDADMLRTFNCGVGMIIVADRGAAGDITLALRENGAEPYEIGYIESGPREVVFRNAVRW